MAKETEAGGWSDYLKEQQAVRERMVKLKALRLEKEAREGKDSKAPAKKSIAKKSPASKTSKKSKVEGANLSEWLDDQRKDGRE
jgi:hypothetical protein